MLEDADAQNILIHNLNKYQSKHASSRNQTATTLPQIQMHNGYVQTTNNQYYDAHTGKHVTLKDIKELKLKSN